ncbi:DUF6879 family protein [Promicromonospora sp. NPDC057488]|uniref:DUF6879 family protein n=1 Tax=Promicromonospora sp. NPDC057488 TaxID=3346147 RepID=UPI00366FC157
MLKEYEHSAFRLETRDSYASPTEETAFQQFLAGESVDMGWFQNWLASIRATTANGRAFHRVRVVSVPLSDYVRFSLGVARLANEAGEDIRYVARQDAVDLPEFDYWLFDSRTVGKMHFDDVDTFLGVELIEDPAVVVELNYQRDAAWHRAIPRDDFAAEHIDEH